MRADRRKLHQELWNLLVFWLYAIVATSKINEVNSLFKSRKCFSFIPHSVQKDLYLCSRNPAFTLDLLPSISFLTFLRLEDLLTTFDLCSF